MDVEAKASAGDLLHGRQRDKNSLVRRDVAKKAEATPVGGRAAAGGGLFNGWKKGSFLITADEATRRGAK